MSSISQPCCRLRLLRLRPKLAVLTIIAGPLLVFWVTGTGSEVVSRTAAPTVGGMVSLAVLTLAVIPAIDALVRQWRLKRGLEG